MKIRLATKKDSPAVEQIFDLYWSDSFRNNLSAKLNSFLTQEEEARKQNLQFIVAELEGAVVGVAAFRAAPEHMTTYVKTTKPAEFYVSAVSVKGKGVGTVLRNERLKMIKEQGYTEAVFFSGETHKDSWSFHDNSIFERSGEMVSLNGEKGYVWRLEVT